MIDRISEVKAVLNQIMEKLDKMDKEIKGVKKSIDKKMNKLVKDDVKRDKKCDMAQMKAKKKK